MQTNKSGLVAAVTANTPAAATTPELTAADTTYGSTTDEPTTQD